MAASRAPRRLARVGMGTLVAMLGIAVLAAGALLLVRAVPGEKFVEYRMGEPQDAPIAIAAGADGSIWFTIDNADTIGRLRNGRVERLPTSNRNIEPLGLAVAPDGSAWYADPTGYGVTRLKDGVFTRHQIESARGGPYGVAVAADGAIWATLQSGNQLLNIATDGTSRTFDLPRGGAVPTDVALGSDGS